MSRLALCLMAPLAFAPTAQAAQTQVERGEALFRHTCFVCHFPGGTGTNVLGRRVGAERSLLYQRTDLVPSYVRAVVRKGTGSMPWMSKVEVPDADLDAIIADLTRNSPPPPR